MVSKGLYKTLTILAFFLVSFGLYAQQQVRSGVASSSVSCPFYIPNAFTPNGDNINERFVVAEGENCEVLEFNMKIFDRWGRLVFETNSPAAQDAWDGTFEGQQLAKGVYIYNVTAKLKPVNVIADPNIVSRQGTVVLIR